MFDQGRIVALDTPEGLISRSESPIVISFRSTHPLPELLTLPGAASVVIEGGRFAISGTDETVQALMSMLAEKHVTIQKLRILDATLDDAFLSITGKAEVPVDRTDIVQGVA